MNETCRCINRNARPNNKQLITYYQHVSYLLRILQYLVNNTYNKDFDRPNAGPNIQQTCNAEFT